MRTLRMKLAMALLLLFVSPVWAVTYTYYVDDTTGLDTDSGLTEALAWKTLGKAADEVAAGDHVYVKIGT